MTPRSLRRMRRRSKSARFDIVLKAALPPPDAFPAILTDLIRQTVDPSPRRRPPSAERDTLSTPRRPTGRAQGRIGSRFGKLEEFWIGATDIEREGQFRWVNGQGLGFARWYSSQPSKSYPNNEHCVTFNYWGADTKWGDRNCFDSRPFLCETMVCRPARRRFPGGYPGQFRGPMRNPYQFPRNQNFPGPRGLGGISTNRLPLGRGFPYNSFQRVRTPINL